MDRHHVDAARGNAGCLIRSGSRVLLVRHLAGGKLGFPAGRPEGVETAQCTAHRETWEEAGLHVRVGRLLDVFDNGFRLYECVPVDAAVLTRSRFDVPAAGRDEIREIRWVEVSALEIEDWRFPQHFARTRRALAAASTP